MEAECGPEQLGALWRLRGGTWNEAAQYGQLSEHQWFGEILEEASHQTENNSKIQQKK